MEENKFEAVGCLVLTVSDTRTPATDRSGALIVERLTSLGHRVIDHSIIADEASLITTRVEHAVRNDEIDIIITTGGTGITRRDVTPDAIAKIATKHIPGFGELFRYLSYAEIGASTIQSRADAWLCESTIVFALPGSVGAVRLALDKILLDQLDSRTKPCNFIQLLPRIKG
ncbi:MAG: molybdopterin-binding protein [Myxococcota bacterium]|nr:molybdopterin-binding protein [Myxococcota bacterium]